MLVIKSSSITNIEFESIPYAEYALGVFCGIFALAMEFGFAVVCDPEVVQGAGDGCTTSLFMGHIVSLAVALFALYLVVLPVYRVRISRGSEDSVVVESKRVIFCQSFRELDRVPLGDVLEFQIRERRNGGRQLQALRIAELHSIPLESSWNYFSCYNAVQDDVLRQIQEFVDPTDVEL